MPDVVSPEKRKEIMSKVRSNKNKSTELRLIILFRRFGIKGWKRDYPVKGHPDFVFLPERLAVFVDGCFWHGHDCRSIHPQTNADYWMKKIAHNKERDQVITALFLQRGWVVIRVWECSLKATKQNDTIERIALALKERRN